MNVGLEANIGIFQRPPTRIQHFRILQCFPPSHRPLRSPRPPSKLQPTPPPPPHSSFSLPIHSSAADTSAIFPANNRRQKVFFFPKEKRRGKFPPILSIFLFSSLSHGHEGHSILLCRRYIPVQEITIRAYFLWKIACVIGDGIYFFAVTSLIGGWMILLKTDTKYKLWGSDGKENSVLFSF